ncbi:MAG: hypothetical protein JWM68_3647 [Verrucomicrobiales bacterium]|nr:hypothetical protein [Verrucomicrobiales bacterium]
MFRRHKLLLLIILWGTITAFGLHSLMTYKGTPGAVGHTPETWPHNELIANPSAKPLLVMFAHPRCPCTKASLGELELLVAQAKDRFAAAVLFYEPENGSAAWSKTASVEMARSIPGVRVIIDRQGAQAKRFAAETSGHTVVYSRTGQLLFSGGITGARGHLGENGGFDSVLKLVRQDASPSLPRKTDVFGCGLFDRCIITQTAQRN